MRIVSLLVAVASLFVAAPAAAAVEFSDPFPVGVCVRATAVDPKPVCVMVDPLD